MSAKLSDDQELEAIALALIDRGDDAANILSAFVDSNLDAA